MIKVKQQADQNGKSSRGRAEHIGAEQSEGKWRKKIQIRVEQGDWKQGIKHGD